MKRWKKILLLTGLIVAAWIAVAPKFEIGGGGSNQYPPDLAKAGKPTEIGLILSVWGQGGAIQDRYENIVLHYRLSDETDYKTVDARPAPLPENYKNADIRNNRYEAYKFTIPAYPLGTKGEIEYYIEMTLDGYKNKTDGLKRIPISS